MNTKQIGDFGENAAAEFLEDNDYEILERNFRMKFGEIDIIAEKDGCMVFVEVKTRRGNAFGEPSQYVDYRKQRHIRQTASAYANIETTEMRFDVIEVFYGENNSGYYVKKIGHIENAF